MIVESGNRIIFEGNGIATDFPFSFIIVNATDIKVAISDNESGEVTVLTSDYFVDTAASKVVYPGYSPGQEPADEAIPEVLPVGKKLIVYRSVPLTQESDLGSKYPFDTIEKGLDKNCILIQQIADAQSRSLTLPVNTPLGFATDLPTPEPGTSFRVNDTGTGYEVTVDPATVLPLAENIKAEVEAIKEETEELKDQAETAATTAATEAAATAAASAVSDVQDVLEDIVEEVNTAKATAVASASTATTKASEALASATSATSAASTATTASSNASNYASQAQTASSAAVTAGNTATAKAGEASTAASTASTAAETATSAKTTVAGYLSSVESSVAEVNAAKASALGAAASADSSASTATTAAYVAASSKAAAAQSAAEAAQSAADAAAAAGGDFIPSAQKGGVNGVATLDGSALLSSTQIPAIPASKITGTINLDNLPQGALERLVHVANVTAMYQLTTAQVQNGDTVQLDDTQVMYRVVDDTKLNSADGYKVFTAGLATSVPWSGVTGKPDLATVATSGSYNDLSNKPTIPSKVSQLTNDTGFITALTMAIANNFLQRSKAYAVGDVVYSPNLKSYLYLQCCTAGATSSSELSLSSVSAGEQITDGTAKFFVKDKRCPYGTGCIIQWASGEVDLPSYYYGLLADGSTFSKTQYPALAEIYPSGVLPNLMDKYLKNTETAGTIGTAGLPNLAGSVINNIPSFQSDQPTGVFAPSITGTYSWAGSIASKYTGISFDASRYNSIYGNSNTVDTDRYTVKAYICYA